MVEHSLDIVKAHCPRCDGERNCSVHGALDEPWEWSEGPNSNSGQVDHRLLKCLGCETVFYWRSSWDDHDWEGRIGEDGKEEIYHPVTITTYPTPEKGDTRPDWMWNLSSVDPQLSAILKQTYDAVETEGFILAAVGLRTALDRTTEFLKIEPNLPLEKKIEALQANGFIGETEANVLATVVDAGSAAAHRGWAPDAAEFHVLCAALVQFIERTVVNGTSALEIAARIPARQSRLKKAPKA